MKNPFNRFIPTIYVQVSPERLTLRNPRSGMVISEVPEIAISYGDKVQIVGAGSEASSYRANPSVKVLNPFAHPRSLVSDFTVAEHLLKIFLRRMQRSSFFAISPKVIFHPMGEPVGGFTQVEFRAFREMAFGAGAAQVVIWAGHPLTDRELLSEQYPAGDEEEI
jgi:rod shape-determining protein MreB